MLTFQRWRDIQREHNVWWDLRDAPGVSIHRKYAKYAEAYRMAEASVWAVRFGND